MREIIYFVLEKEQKLINNQEKNVVSENAKRAEISDFEKKEVRKALDEIAEGAMRGKRIDFVKKGAKKKTTKTTEIVEAAKTIPVEKSTPVKKNASVKKIAPVKKAVASISEKKVAPKEETVKERPTVSVIIPVHNGARYIDSAIHSVLGQTFRDFELIIVDDCSEDGTLRVVREFATDKIVVVSLKQKGGMAQARNQGVEVAQGKYIAFLNAQDMWQPEKLEMQLMLMEEKKCAFSYTGYVYSDEDGMPSGKAIRVPSVITAQQMIKTSIIWVSTVMFDMSVLSKTDVKMPATQNPKNATWQKVLKRVGRACGLNEIMVIRGYDAKIPFWKKVWRRV